MSGKFAIIHIYKSEATGVASFRSYTVIKMRSQEQQN